MTDLRSATRTVTADLGHGRVLRIRAEADPAGVAELAEGWAGGGTDPRRSVRLPVGALPALRDALAALLDAVPASEVERQRAGPSGIRGSFGEKKNLRVAVGAGSPSRVEMETRYHDQLPGA